MAQRIEDLIVSFRGDLQGLRQALQDANNRIARFEQTVNKRAARINSLFGAIAKSIRSALLPAALLIFSRQIIGLLTRPIREFREFEKALVAVGKVADIEGRSLEHLGATIERLGTSTLPIATKELLTITETAARLGIRGTQNLERFTGVVAGLTLATDVTAEAGATNLARLLNLTGTAVQQVDRVGAALVELGNTFPATEAAILEFALNIGRHTSAYNFAAQDVLGLGTAYASLGLNVESGSASIGRALIEMNKIIRGNQSNIKLLSEVTGTTTEGLRQLAQSDQAQLLLRLIRGLGRVIASGGSAQQVLHALGVQSIRSIAALQTLARRWELVDRAMTSSNEAFDNNEALMREVAKQSLTLDSRIKVLVNSFNEFIRANNGVARAVKGTVNALNDAFSDVTLEDLEGILTGIEREQRLIQALREGANIPNLSIEGAQRAVERYQSALGRFTPELLRQNLGVVEEQISQLTQRLSHEETRLIEAVHQRLTEGPFGGQFSVLRNAERAQAGVVKGVKTELTDREKIRDLLRDYIASLNEARGDGATGDVDPNLDVEGGFNKLRDLLATQVDARNRLIEAYKQGDDAVRRTAAELKVEELARRKNVALTDEQKQALIELVLQSGNLEEALKKLRKAARDKAREDERALSAAERARESNERLLEQQRRSAEENARLAAALLVSRDAYEQVKDAIDAERIALRLNEHATEAQRQTLLQVVQAAQRYRKEIEELQEEYDKQQAAIDEVRGSVKDFAADAITDFDNIGDHFRSFTNRLFRLWFDNVVDRIFQQYGFDALFGAFAGALTGGFTSAVSRSAANSRLVGTGPQHRQFGGSVAPFRTYRVNEGGRSETFLTPEGRGYIIPSADTRRLIRQAGAASAPTINQVININTEVTGDEELNAKLGRAVELAKRQARDLVFSEIKAGGEARRIVSAA